MCLSPLTGEFTWNKPFFGRVYSSCPVVRGNAILSTISGTEQILVGYQIMTQWQKSPDVHHLARCAFVVQRGTKHPTTRLWGHPFMTSTRRGEGSGSGGCMWMEEGGCPMWTSTQKIKHRIH